MPNNIRCDSGPEFISKVFHEWCEANSINIIHIQPGEPTRDSYIERFNGSYRRGVLDAYIFRTLDEVRQITEDWMNDCNNERPHYAAIQN
jgi:putative transposase